MVSVSRVSETSDYICLVTLTKYCCKTACERQSRNFFVSVSGVTWLRHAARDIRTFKNTFNNFSTLLLLLSFRWGFLLITFAVLYDTLLVTIRYFDERQMRKKIQKPENYFDECTPGQFGNFNFSHTSSFVDLFGSPLVEENTHLRCKG